MCRCQLNATPAEVETDAHAVVVTQFGLFSLMLEVSACESTVSVNYPRQPIISARCGYFVYKLHFVC